MPFFLCCACGTQFAESTNPPESCPICRDERQFVPESGQAWISYEDVQGTHCITWRDEAPGIISLNLSPDFGIGQRAFLVKTSAGLILWDCLSVLDASSICRIKEAGGLSAIAISHPHYYSSMVEWGRAFDAPVYLHEDDAEWIQRPDPCLCLWSGEQLDLPGSVTLVRCGGHYPGGTVMHWDDGAGLLFSGDVIQVAQDRAYVSFMYSYPNMIPLDAGAIRRIAEAVSGFQFDSLYGAFPGRTIKAEARSAVDRSVVRYLRAIGAS